MKPAIAVLSVLVLGLVGWYTYRSEESVEDARTLTRTEQLVQDERWEEAREALEARLTEVPDDERSLFLLGVTLLALGRADEGAARLEAALAIDPELPGAHLRLARYHEAAGRLREALDHAAAAPEPSAHLLRARLLARLDRPAGAARAAWEAVMRGEEDLDTLLAALDLHQRLPAERGGGSPENLRRVSDLVARVRRRAEQMLEADPENRAALRARALALEEGGLATAEEIDDAWRAALTANPDDLEARRRYGRFLERRGEMESARRIFAGGRSRGGAEAWVLYAGHLDRRGDREEALSVLGEAEERWPDDPRVVAARIALLDAPGREGEALAEAREFLDTHLDEAALQETAGDLEARLGNDAAAADRYERAVAAEPGRTSALKKLIRPWKPELLRAAAAGEELPEEARRAEARIETLRAANPWDRDALLWAAEISAARGRLPLARNLLDQLLDDRPEDRDARRLRGRLRFEAGRTRDAAADLAPLLDAPDASREDYALYLRAVTALTRHRDIVNATRKGLSRWPADADLLRRLGTSLLALDRGPEFLEDLERAPPELREDPDVRVLEAWAEVRAGRPEKGERILAAAVGDPPDPARLREYVRLLFEIGEREKAEKLLREAGGD